MTLHCEHVLFLYEYLFDLVFYLSAMDGKFEQRVCIKFFMKLSKFTNLTLEMFHGAYGECLNGIHISLPVE
jgi:hypothetical protein